MTFEAHSRLCCVSNTDFVLVRLPSHLGKHARVCLCVLIVTQLYCSIPVIHLFRLSQVLPWLLQTHCCLFFEKDSGKV